MPSTSGDKEEFEALTKKPVCFVIFGKPGTGKTTLSKNLSAVWKCHLVASATSVEEAIQNKTVLGEEAERLLRSGVELPESNVIEIIKEKLNSPDIAHYGYILDCFPHAESLNPEEQLSLIHGLKLSPDIVINLKIPDQDLEVRRLEQRVDPINNLMFGHSVLSLEAKQGDSEDNEGEDEEEITNDPETLGKDLFEQDLAKIDTTELSVAETALSRLVRRGLDLQFAVKKHIEDYHEHLLGKIENFIISHDQQSVIELDANLPPKELFKSLLVRLTSMGLCRVPTPVRLVDPSEGEEEPEGLDNDQFLQQLSEINNLLPKFRWRRSKWGRYCPFELAQGNMVPGRMEFAVGFLDKMYCLSSEGALKKFVCAPRDFLLPPNPKIPCKVCVVGPPLSGKSTLAKGIADKYNAMVLVMSDLLEPVLVRAREAVVEEAKVEAENTTINTISAQLAAQAAHQGEEAPEVTASHPDVISAVQQAAEKARTTPLEYTQEMYMEALREGVTEAERRKKDNPDEPRFGGWVVDGFPETRENWAAMIDASLLPDFVLSIEDDQAPPDYLLGRFAEMKGLPDPATLKASAKSNQEEETAPVILPDEIVQWQQKKKDHDKLWGQLSASMKGSAIDPLSINCSLSTSEMLSSAVKQMEDVFQFKVSEYSIMEDDADADDDPSLGQGEGEEEEDESEEQMLKKKPWGDTHHFCPVALAEKGVLWPGNSDIAVRYRERLYFFSSEKAKEDFIANPDKYIGPSGSIKPPPVRVFLLGPRSAGKTTVGRDVAKELGIFHISFQEYLQEVILPKMKKPPLVSDDDWDPPESEENSTDKGEDDDDLDEDVCVKLTEEESEIRGYLVHGEALSDEIIMKFVSKFWNEEPYKSTGFILEGFPSTPDDMNILASKGLHGDCAIIFQIEESDAVKRLLPGTIEIWKKKKKKRLEKKAIKKEKQMTEWEADKAERKAELKAEYEEKVAAKKAANQEDEDDEEEVEEVDEDLAEYEEAVAEIDQEEFPEQEEEEEEEEEEDARERIKTSIAEKYEEQTELASNVKDALVELQIPCLTVDAGRKVAIVQYSLSKALRPYTMERQGLLAKCTAVDEEMAKKLLDHGYKQLSSFKLWCPVKLCEIPGAVLPPSQPLKSQMFPVIYHGSIYFLSSSEARAQFMSNPEKFISRPPPENSVPVRLAIVGPPMSGKSSVAKRFSAEYGCVRISIGEAVRMYIDNFPDSKLTELILSHLKSGKTVPDDLCVHALERVLLDVQCTTRGYVLDGWPLTKEHVDLLTKFRIIPVCVVELDVTDKEMLRRAELGRSSANRTVPLHDSPAILAIRSSLYRKNIAAVRKWYREEHNNYVVVDGGQSVWWVWSMVNGYALRSAQQIRHYLHRITSGKAASIHGLCITPKEFEARLGEFGEYCPVSLTLRSELVDCSSETSQIFCAEYNGKYYKMSSQADLDKFLLNPECFVLPQAPRALPPPDELPRKKSHADVKAMFPKQVEIQGFCPVTYVDGGMRYESLCPGCPDIVVEYKGKLYCFKSAEKQDKFMRQPEQYEVTCLPAKLPPLKQPLPITSLPMLGYLEQTVAVAIINSLSAVGALKPKFPFLTSTKSALFYMACHLKAFNPKSSGYVRKKYKNKLAQFEEQCNLIEYLSSKMRQGYKEPVNRPIDFNFKMNTFLQLQNVEDSLQSVH